MAFLFVGSFCETPGLQRRLTQTPYNFELGALSFHSALSVTIGLTREARRAGIQQAKSAAQTRTNVTAPEMRGSFALTPKSTLRIARESANAPRKRRINPLPSKRIPRRSITVR